MKRQLRECQTEMVGLREAAVAAEASLRREVDELRAEVEDLAEKVKVKDIMLDDQNVALGNAKQTIKAKEDELLRERENGGKHSLRWEEMLA